MPRYTDDSKQKLRDAVDFADLVGRYTELRRSGPTRLQGLCPFHDERTPSFGIDPGDKVYYCFGCGAGGDVFRFIQEKENLDFGAAMEWLADRYGVEMEVVDDDPQAAARRARQARLLEVLERTASFYTRYLWESAEAAKAREYLAERGLDEEVLRQFRVGFSPSRWDTISIASRKSGFKDRELYDAGLTQRSGGTGRTYDRFRGRVMFPLGDRRGKVLGFGARKLGDGEGPKYLNSTENAVFHKGQNVYAADIARQHAAKERTVLLCEGYTDVIALHQSGIRNAVGLMGTALTADQVLELQRLAPTVLLCLDADSAGQEAMLRAAKVAAGRGVDLRVVPLPEGSDPADVVLSDGAEAMKQHIARSVPFVRFRVDRALASEDMRSAEGKDRAIAALGEVMADVPRSALREELVERISGKTDLDVQLVVDLLEANKGPREPAARPARPAPARPAPEEPEPGESWDGPMPWDDEAPGPSPVAAPSRTMTARDPLVAAERKFLATCVAIPEAARELLASLDIDSTFSDALDRRAARFLQIHVAAPTQGLAGDDPELESLVAELVVRAPEHVGRATLEAELAALRLAALERRIQRARQSADPALVELTGERVRLRTEMQRAIERATDGE